MPIAVNLVEFWGFVDFVLYSNLIDFVVSVLFVALVNSVHLVDSIDFVDWQFRLLPTSISSNLIILSASSILPN